MSRDQAGNIIVADGQAFEVRVFDPQGQHVLSFGQEGGGPGDFQSLDAVWPLEDGSLLAVDDRLGRISRFDMNGRLVETATLENNVDLSANVFRPGGPGMGPFLRQPASQLRIRGRHRFHLHGRLRKPLLHWRGEPPGAVCTPQPRRYTR